MSLFYRYQAIFFRALLCVVTTAIVVYLLPRGASFQYEIQEGKPWQYETLLAPYDFPIQKSEEELSIEKEALEANIPRYFSVQDKVVSTFLSSFDQYASTLPASPEFNAILINWRTVMEEIYAKGIIADAQFISFDESIALVKNTSQTTVSISDLYSEKQAKDTLLKQLTEFGNDVLSETTLQYLLSLVVPSISYNDDLTRQFKAEAVAAIIPVRGLVTKGTRIIAKGEVVEGEKLQKLQSLQQEFESQTWTQSNTIWIILGYSLLVLIPVLLLFVVNGLAILFVQPLIYIFEKLFGLVSDASLLELSDTNSRLLRELADKAPGTFQHSLQVANIAEAAANAIGANTLLTRVGALYHDVGKMKNPVFFSENQATYNPHDDLEPEVSAKIIIDHVLNGIASARKSKLPDRVIDFIRTHHGTTTVLYFFQQAKQNNSDVEKGQYEYPGPKPFSKETAIVMISDGVEAASKSLKEPTAEKIFTFVDKIVQRLMDEKQFLEANITLREIETIKRVLSEKLISSYHLRVSYPE